MNSQDGTTTVPHLKSLPHVPLDLHALYPSNTCKSGLETTRTLTSSTSQSNINTFSTQCETTKGSSNKNDSANLSQIKTELKDKIQSTRDRFNQLKLRKRQQQHSDLCGSNATTNLGSTRSNLYQTYRSNSNKGQSFISLHLEKKSKKQMREDSLGSDEIDRDEETIPLSSTLTNLNIIKENTMTSQALKSHIKKGLKASFNRTTPVNIPSYKLDGAKLIVNRLQVQLKKRFELVCEVYIAFNPKQVLTSGIVQADGLHPKGKQLKDKWKFVRSVMDNMEKHKKQPLQDKTNHISQHQNFQQQQQSNFNQIQQMFENFKNLRASSTSSGGKQIPQNNQENQIPTYTLKNPQKISKSKDMIGKRRPKDLPPALSRRGQPTNNTFDLRSLHLDQMNTALDGDSFTSTFRENDFFINYQTTQDHFPTQMLTSRSNLVLDDEYPEGLQQLPLESPMNQDKFIQRRQYLKQDQHVQMVQQQLMNLAKIQQKVAVRKSFVGLKKKCRASQLFGKLLKRRIQEDKLIKMTRLKQAFVRMIKNCIYMSKLDNFLERAYQRLLEKAFDKIKENNWIIEERKEVLEQIFLKRRLKQAFMSMADNNKVYHSVNTLCRMFTNYHSSSQLQRCFTMWQQEWKNGQKAQRRIGVLQEIIEKQHFKKQGFQQFKSNTIQAVKKERAVEKILGLYEKSHCLQAMQQWKKMSNDIVTAELKLSIMSNVLQMHQNLYRKQCFLRWREQANTLKVQQQCRVNQGVYLIMKPLLNAKAKALKQQAFTQFKARTDQMKRVEKQLRYMCMGFKQQQRVTLAQYFGEWKHSKVQIVQTSYIEDSEHYESSCEEVDGKDIFCESEVIQQEEQWVDTKAEEDFEQLTQIRRLSYETNILSKLASEGISEERMEPLQPLRFNKRVSDSFGKAQKVTQNLRYL